MTQIKFQWHLPLALALSEQNFVCTHFLFFSFGNFFGHVLFPQQTFNLSSKLKVMFQNHSSSKCSGQRAEVLIFQGLKGSQEHVGQALE